MALPGPLRGQRRGSASAHCLVVRRLRTLMRANTCPHKTLHAAGLTLLALAVYALSAARVAFAQDARDIQFTASGVVDSQYYSEGNLTSHLTNGFTCYVSKAKYSIFFTANSEAKLLRSLDCLFDGTNTYLTTRFSTNPVTAVSTMDGVQIPEHIWLKPRVPNNNAFLQITKGSMPWSANLAVSLVWVSLASSAEPTEVLATSQAPLTFLGMVYSNQHIKLRAASRKNGNFPNFLEWREDYHEGATFSETLGVLQRTPFTGAMSLGYTNSTYNVVAWTNVAGLSFPKQTQLKAYFPTKDKSNVECRIVCSAFVSAIQIGNPDTSFKPVVEPKTTVIDRRPESDGGQAGPFYLSMDGGLLSLSQITNNSPYRVSPHQLDNVHTKAIP